ncbi:CpsD/CapB family tyrosine-protein kinase [Bacillus pseudomycoides]|uniref:CpsD/CapB family tyrosine-protein kinase n=1 Tax=Bacillus pseudomycoides TaxID=64104 RepID=UPI000BEC42B7|nr:CpsD/CapB family tyrosine-protein kinase [Bacillus pseudomycoides]PEF75499.1 capsular biosynthesis protein [Bacillus pseudomycoides]PEI43320.1 capsular biosynthesis protein [Bacillus pseudomycoides]PEJ38426.1 capsular biosynthesis protein [Bacillus pseudomycoides]PEL87165.1 capsular biosynthesis protein [Bacillus pseudomycoides]PGA69694.1 capsular biosynthesis protein [Bacillus pseudomycoides]
MTIKFKRKYFFNPYDITIKERFYSICNHIEPNLQKEKPILMITSLAQTQNITNATAYLALAFSEQRKRVLVVDANLRQPSLHHVFNIDHSFGLTTLLLREQNKDTTIKITDYLSCLSTGEDLYEPVALLTLETFPILIEEWKEHFDIILFHTSDFLNTPDAQILAKHCDGIVLVIQEGRDKLDKITNVKKQLEHSNHEIIGTVIIS